MKSGKYELLKVAHHPQGCRHREPVTMRHNQTPKHSWNLLMIFIGSGISAPLALVLCLSRIYAIVYMLAHRSSRRTHLRCMRRKISDIISTREQRAREHRVCRTVFQREKLGNYIFSLFVDKNHSGVSSDRNIVRFIIHRRTLPMPSHTFLGCLSRS